MQKQTSKALVVAGKSKPTSITTVGDQFFIRLAAELKHELAPAKLALVKTKLESWSESLEAFQKNIRDRCLDALKAAGKVVTDKGSVELTEGGYVLSARPWRTGYSAKKVEALLRAKGLHEDQLMKYMDRQVSYKLSEEKLGVAVGAGILTKAELDASCRDGVDEKGEVIMALQPVRKVEE